MISNLGKRSPFPVLLTLAAGLLGGCASNQSADAPPTDAGQSPIPAAATSVSQSIAPAPASEPAFPNATTVSPTPTSPPDYTTASVPPAPAVQPAAVTYGPPPAARAFTDKEASASYLSTWEYQEAAEYQAALDHFLTDPFIVANYQAADKLVENSQGDMAGYSKLVIAPFGDLDRPEQATPLGKVITGQIASRFAQLGYQVAEADSSIRPASQRYPGGYAPARDLWDLASRYNARAVIVGNYAVSQDRIFVNARLIDTAVNNRIMSAYDYALPLNKTTLALVTGCFKQGQWICRMP